MVKITSGKESGSGRVSERERLETSPFRQWQKISGEGETESK